MSCRALLVFAAVTLTTPATANAAPHRYLVEIKGKKGYIDQRGRLKIRPRYHDAEDFSEGLAAVQRKKGGAWGYIDHRGRRVIKPRFRCPDARCLGRITKVWVRDRYEQFSYGPAYPFSQGRARITLGSNRYVFVDQKGKQVGGEHYYAKDFSDGLAVVCVKTAKAPDGMRCGAMDLAGKVVIRPAYDEMKRFSEKLAAVQQGKLWGFIDVKGKVVIKPVYREVGRFSQGRAAVGLPNGRWGYIDATGKWVIKPRFRGARAFGNGVAPATDKPALTSMSWYLIDLAGKRLGSTTYMDAQPVRHGRMEAAVFGGKTLVDSKGRLLSKRPPYNDVMSLPGPLSRVTTNDHWGYVDNRGRFKWKRRIKDTMKQTREGLLKLLGTGRSKPPSGTIGSARDDRLERMLRKAARPIDREEEKKEKTNKAPKRKP